MLVFMYACIYTNVYIYIYIYNLYIALESAEAWLFNNTFFVKR